MTAIHKIIPVVAARKKDSATVSGMINDILGRPDHFTGMRRLYAPLDDEGETFPNEDKKILRSYKSVVDAIKLPWVALVNATHTLDLGNQAAKSDITIDGVVVCPDIPVTTLIFLEKKVKDLILTIERLPTADPNFDWKKDETGMWKSQEIVSRKTKKVPRPITLAEATDRHPAQVHLQNVDEHIGDWKTTHLFQGVSVQEKSDLLAKANKMKDAIVEARENANTTEVKSQDEGEKIFEFIFGA